MDIRIAGNGPKTKKLGLSKVQGFRGSMSTQGVLIVDAGRRRISGRGWFVSTLDILRGTWGILPLEQNPNIRASYPI